MLAYKQLWVKMWDSVYICVLTFLLLNVCPLYLTFQSRCDITPLYFGLHLPTDVWLHFCPPSKKYDSKQTLLLDVSCRQIVMKFFDKRADNLLEKNVAQIVPSQTLFSIIVFPHFIISPLWRSCSQLLNKPKLF